MRKYIGVIAALILLCTVGCTDEKIAQAELAAQDAAADWLELVDNGQYEESWHQTARFSKTPCPRKNGWKPCRLSETHWAATSLVNCNLH